jgi:hypothetical protein
MDEKKSLFWPSFENIGVNLSSILKLAKAQPGLYKPFLLLTFFSLISTKCLFQNELISMFNFKLGKISNDNVTIFNLCQTLSSDILCLKGWNQFFKEEILSII